MTSRLISRVERLEARAKAKAPSALCSGFLTPLPQDYTGERHVVTVTREPTGSPGCFWCQYEERPGPAPPGLDDDADLHIYLTQ
jgi:hypothetical protein